MDVIGLFLIFYNFLKSTDLKVQEPLFHSWLYLLMSTVDEVAEGQTGISL